MVPRWWPSSERPVLQALVSLATSLVFLGVAHVLAALTGITEWTAWLILGAVLGFWALMAEIRRLRRETAERRNANEGAGLRE